MIELGPEMKDTGLTKFQKEKEEGYFALQAREAQEDPLLLVPNIYSVLSAYLRSG